MRSLYERVRKWLREWLLGKLRWDPVPDLRVLCERLRRDFADELFVSYEDRTSCSSTQGGGHTFLLWRVWENEQGSHLHFIHSGHWGMGKPPTLADLQAWVDHSIVNYLP